MLVHNGFGQVYRLFFIFRIAMDPVVGGYEMRLVGKSQPGMGAEQIAKQGCAASGTAYDKDGRFCPNHGCAATSFFLLAAIGCGG